MDVLWHMSFSVCIRSDRMIMSGPSMLLPISWLHSLIWKTNFLLNICTRYSLSLTDPGHFGCSPVLAVVSRGAVTSGAQGCSQGMVFSRCTHRCVMLGPHAGSLCSASTVLHSAWHRFHSQQHRGCVSFYLSPLLHLLLCEVFLMMAILTGKRKWYLVFLFKCPCIVACQAPVPRI